MDYVKTLAYHCQNCGGLIEPDACECSYCGSKLSFRTDFIKRGKKLPIRVFISTKNGKKIYLHETLGLTSSTAPERIEATSLEDDYQHYIMGNRCSVDFSINIPTTKRVMEKGEYICEQKPKEVFIETEGFDIAYSFEVDKAYVAMPDFSPDEILTTKMIFYTNSAPKQYDKKIFFVNDGTTCPNCGAGLRKRFGLCDYCGGWVNIRDYYE